MSLKRQKKKTLRSLDKYQKGILKQFLHKANRLLNQLLILQEEGIDGYLLVGIKDFTEWSGVFYDEVQEEDLNFFIRQLQNINQANVRKYFIENHDKEIFDPLRNFPNFLDMEILIQRWLFVIEAKNYIDLS